MSTRVNRSWSLKWRFAAWLVALMAAVALTAGVLHNALLAELRQAEMRRLERERDQLALDWQLRMQALRADVQLLAEAPAIAGIARAVSNEGLDPEDGSSDQTWRLRFETLLVALLRTRPSYSQARLIGFEDGGLELVRVERDGSTGEITVRRGTDLQREGEEPYLQASRDSESGLILSPITLNREFGRISEPWQGMVRAQAPVVDADSEPYGVVIVNMDVRTVLDEQRAGLPPTLEYLVANRAGQVLFDESGSPGFRFEFEPDTGLAGISPAIASALAGTDGRGAEVLRADGLERSEVARIVQYDPERSEASLLVHLRAARSDAATSAARAARRAALPLGILMLFASGASFVLVDRAVRPFARLARDIEGVEEGANEAIPVPSLPEAAAVALAFNATLRRLLDVTEELRRSNSELEHFAYVTSHDLQEPARTVASYSKLLAARHGTELGEEGTAAVDFLLQASNRMLALIHDLLEYSRIGQGSPLRDVDLNIVARDVLSDLGTSIDETGATVDVASLPVVVGRENDYRMLLQNLVANALKFGRPDTPPHVTIRCVEDRTSYRFSISDNGVGMPEGAESRVFQLFGRAHPRSEYEGTGIGLAHCRKIAELYGGRIWIGTPERHPGCTIHFTLPKADFPVTLKADP